MTVRQMVLLCSRFSSDVSSWVWDLKAAYAIEGIMDDRAIGISGSLGRDGEDCHSVTECRC